MRQSPPPSTGIPGLDATINGLRPGDNVVLQVETLADYLPFVLPYVDQAIKEKRKLVYFRFAKHAELMPDMPRVQRVQLSPEKGFETFVSEVVEVIGACGLEAFYVFDSLSELAVDWFSDRMLANFFMIVCPYLYRLDTIAYFALLKKKHSSIAVDGIRNTAQVVIDIFRDGDRLFVQPCKVDGRYSATMFTLHEWRGKAFVPVEASSVVSRVLGHMPQPWLEFSTSRPGPWQVQFLKARQILDRAITGIADPQEIESCFDRLVRMALTRNRQFQDLARTYLTLEDLIKVLGRMIGTGLIGGKSLGMLLARAILKKDCPAAHAMMEPHDSFFVGSDVFYTHMVRNDYWWLRGGETLESRLENARKARRKILAGEFPKTVLQQFTEMLDYFGQSPLIVRSSSLLEDNYGNAFSGKYDSVFCANQGPPAERLQAFLTAVRQVYASSMSRDALIYRARSGLLEQDEQMALLVQRVSGNRYGRQFMPHAAGTGFSFNAYAWHEDIDPNAGMLRMVLGLGTRAVDRTDDDYATLVALNAPHAKPHMVMENPMRYSQKKLDVVDLDANQLAEVGFEDVVRKHPDFPVDSFAELDRQILERARRKGMKKKPFAWLPNLAPLVKDKQFITTVREALKKLEKAYGVPVDIEYTLNKCEDGAILLNLVQCRPFQIKVTKATDVSVIATPPPTSRSLLSSAGPIIGPSAALELDRLIYIVPSEYAKLSMSDRYAVARLIGELTCLGDLPGDATVMLVGPGRWGTSTPALGVPVAFGEIENVSVIVEVAVMHEGLVPDVSLGTHFFNDLVELDMLYVAVSPHRKGHALDQAFFESQCENILADIYPEGKQFASVVRVIQQAGNGRRIHLYADTREQKSTCFLLP